MKTTTTYTPKDFIYFSTLGCLDGSLNHKLIKLKKKETRTGSKNCYLCVKCDTKFILKLKTSKK